MCVENKISLDPVRSSAHRHVNNAVTPPPPPSPPRRPRLPFPCVWHSRRLPPNVVDTSALFGSVTLKLTKLTLLPPPPPPLPLLLPLLLPLQLPPSLSRRRPPPEVAAMTNSPNSATVTPNAAANLGFPTATVSHTNRSSHVRQCFIINKMVPRTNANGRAKPRSLLGKA